MNKELFRKKSLDSFCSPDNLNDYIRVSNPGVWLILISVILLLVGACIWGIFGHMENTVPAEFHVDNGHVLCYLDEKEIKQAKPGMSVRFDDWKGTLVSIGEKKELWYVCTVETDMLPKDGIYTGELILDSIRPISLLLD